MKSHAVAQTADTEESISPIVGQFYKVRYSFIYGKGGEVVQVLPAMCSKNNLEEHLFTFSKSIWQNHYLLNDSNQACVRYKISMKFFHSQILPVKKSINGSIKYENFMFDVSLISILNLICYWIFFKYLIFILTSIDLFRIWL